MNPQNDLLNIRLPRLLKFHLPKSLRQECGLLGRILQKWNSKNVA
jgi:hypothetical protein